MKKFIFFDFDSSSVWPDGKIIFQYLAIYNNEHLPNSIKLSKVCSKFWHGQNKPSKNCPRFYFRCQSGEISPNLVTLFVIQKASCDGSETLWNNCSLYYRMKWSTFFWRKRLLLKIVMNFFSHLLTRLLLVHIFQSIHVGSSSAWEKQISTIVTRGRRTSR